MTARRGTQSTTSDEQGRGARPAARWLHPQDYSRDGPYRPPAQWYRRLNPVGVPLTMLGLAPRDAVTLEVRGRRTGQPRRIPILVTRHEGADYLVALAGESQWVRNVRAAGGEASLRRRGTRRVRLEEVPVAQRAPVLAAYLDAGRRRSGEPAAREQARWYFGLQDPATPERLAELAPRYPVFRMTDTARRDESVLVREITPGRGGHRHPLTERGLRVGGRAVMTRITGEVTIDTSITEVFDTVADERNEPRYNPRIARAEMLTDEPVGAGSHFVAEPKGMGARGQIVSETLEYQRPHRLTTADAPMGVKRPREGRGRRSPDPCWDGVRVRVR